MTSNLSKYDEILHLEMESLTFTSLVDNQINNWSPLMKVLLVLSIFVALAISSSVNCNASLGHNVLSSEVDEYSVEGLEDCSDRNVCLLKCSELKKGCKKTLFFDLGPIINRQSYGNQFENAYRRVCINRSYSSGQTNKRSFKIINRYLARYTGIPLTKLDGILLLDSKEWNYQYETIFRQTPGLSLVKRHVSETIGKLNWVLRNFDKLCTQKKRTITELTTKFAKFEAEYWKKMYAAGGAEYGSDAGLYHYFNIHGFTGTRDELKSANNKEWVEYQRRLDDIKNIKNAVVRELINEIVRHPSDPLSDFCQCSDFNKYYEWLKEIFRSKMTDEFIWDQWRVTRGMTKEFKRYLDAMTRKCNESAYGNSLDLESEDGVDCSDRNVCLLECKDFVKGCKKTSFFDLGSIINRQVSGNQFENAYRKVCINRSYASSQSNTRTFKLINKVLARYTGIPLSTLNDVLKLDQQQWNSKYETIYRTTSGLSSVKGPVAEAMMKFNWALRKFETLCTQKKRSRSEMAQKFQEFEADYWKKMYAAGGAEYGSDPGLYHYLKLHQFKIYRDLRKSQNSPEYVDFKQRVDDIAKIKENVVKKLIHQIYSHPNQGVADYCKCFDFTKYYEWLKDVTQSKKTDAYLWDIWRITRDNTKEFKPYINTMKRRCSSLCRRKN